MKIIPILIIFCSMIALSSCSKEDDNLQPTDTIVNVMKGNSYNGEILPIIKRDCSNSGCHTAGSKFYLLASANHTRQMVNDGTIHRRLFSNGSPTLCATISPSSLGLLKAWYERVGRID